MLRAVVPLTVASLLAGCKKSPPPPSPEAVAVPVPSAKPAAPQRCKPVSTEAPFVLGPSDTGRGNTEAGEPGRDEIAPFAALVGEGVAYEGGFAVGAIHEDATSLAMSVVTLDPSGHQPKIIPLGVARGDVEPARIVASGSGLALGLLSPDANGRQLRLAKITNGVVTWGATLHAQTSESQSLDIALGEKKGIVVWDEDGPTSSVIQVSTFDSATLGAATPPRTISRAAADADSPRLVPRAGGGYWLAYIAKSATEALDASFVTDEIGFRWIEVVALDANGSPAGTPRAATPKDGHVMVFDFAPAPDGALLMYRNDDTPTGSAGGEVVHVVVRAGAIDAPVIVARDEIGAGVPNVLPGWVAILDAADVTRLAPLGPLGDLAAPLSPEPDIGSGEPIASAGNRLLVARPSGRAVKLVVLECRP